jgi:hypothetical protein
MDDLGVLGITGTTVLEMRDTEIVYGRSTRGLY